MKEVPLELEKLLGDELPNFRITESPRRFYHQLDQFIEVGKASPWYEPAPFGEVILDYVRGRNRFQRITIIYARLMKLEKECSE